jgi:ribosome-binding factor A
MPTRRQERVAHRIVQEVSAIIPTVRDERIGFVTVTACEVSPDLRHAKVLISTLTEGEERETSLNALRHAAGYIRGELGHKLQMKYTPRLHFDFDATIETQDKMLRLIAEARASDPKRPETGESSSEEE